MAREDVRERPRPGKSGGLAGMLNVRQEAFQAVEVVVGLLEQIAERVNPPDRTESFAKQQAGQLVLDATGNFSTVDLELVIAGASSSAIVRRIVIEFPATELEAPGGGAFVYAGGVPLGSFEWSASAAGLPSMGYLELTAGVQADKIRAVVLAGDPTFVGRACRLIAFGELPGRDDS